MATGPAAQPFRVTFRRTGGIAGLSIRTSAADDPDDPDGPAVRAALPDAETLAALPEPTGTPAPPDAYTYELDIAVGTVHRTLTYADPDLPEQLRPLVTVLVRRARRR